jgi:two-component system CheB/CheR fusion protein
VNEELQTAKEEIQSANEELATLNQELQDRNLQLGRSNDDLLNLLSTVNLPIVMVGRDLRLRRFTPAAEKLFNLIPIDVGRPLGDLRTDLEGPALDQEVREVIDAVEVREREVQDRQGRFYVVRIWPYMTRESTIDGAVVVLVDVDALKRSSERIQEALDSANAIVATVREPLLILDGELRVEKANRAFLEAFQAGPEETAGRWLWELHGGHWDRPALRAALQEVLAGDGSFEDLEMEHELPGIGRRTFVLNARRLLGEHGGKGRILLAIEDRTEVRRAERGREAVLALEHAARTRAEAADRLKDEFVATVSHELRGPLTSIAGWLHILTSAAPKLDDATVAQAMAAIERGVEAQTRLIADLLDHSRIVTGKVHLLRAPIDLVALAQATLESVSAAAEAKSIALEVSGEHGASVVLGDHDRMQQVLWNLLSNAVKFTPRGGSVRVWSGRVDTQVHLTVADSGQGIRADFLPHVFERFRQQDSTPAHAQAGLGLGLTLVRELVELHGGTVRAESPGEGQGATFTIALPVPALLLQPPAGAKAGAGGEPRAPSKSATEPDRALLDGLSVLLVDDEADVRNVFAALLERFGARVSGAASVREAMAALEQSIPDVVVSDLGMPDEDGYELIRRVRMLPPEAGGGLPALAVSAYGTEQHRRNALSAGFQVYLGKPLAPFELVTEVARAAGRHGGH